MIGPNKLVFYVTLGWKDLPSINNLAYLAHVVSNKKSISEYSSKDCIRNI